MCIKSSFRVISSFLLSARNKDRYKDTKTTRLQCLIQITWSLFSQHLCGILEYCIYMTIVVTMALTCSKQWSAWFQPWPPWNIFGRAVFFFFNFTVRSLKELSHRIAIKMSQASKDKTRIELHISRLDQVWQCRVPDWALIFASNCAFHSVYISIVNK